MSEVDEQERLYRARQITEEWGGIFPAYEAFYIHSILYTADRSIEAFERYDTGKAEGAVDPDLVSAVHEALSHAASLSRYFWPSGAGRQVPVPYTKLKEARARKLRDAFQLRDSSPLKDRSLRDALEHFDERVDRYLLTSDAGHYMPLPRIGDSSSLPDGRNHVFKLVDSERQVFLVLGQHFAFAPIREEVTRILLSARRMSKTGDRLQVDPGS